MIRVHLLLDCFELNDFYMITELCFMYRDATSLHPYTLFSVIIWWSFIRRSPKTSVHEVLMLLGTKELFACYLDKSRQRWNFGGWSFCHGLYFPNNCIFHLNIGGTRQAIIRNKMTEVISRYIYPTVIMSWIIRRKRTKNKPVKIVSNQYSI